MYTDNRQLYLEMNFDDDDLDLGYTPSVVNNSRSAGMKKLTRKSENKKVDPAPVKKTTQQDDFDLLDELLSPAKPKASTSKTVKQIKKMPQDDDIDSFFDEPSTIKINKDKPKAPEASKDSWNDWGDSKNQSKINTTVNTSLNNRPQTAKGISTTAYDDIIQQTTNERPASTFKFKRPETANISSKQQEIVEEESSFAPTPSLRMMKPPLRKRDSSKDDRKSDANKSQLNRSESGFGLTLIPDQPKSTITIKNEQKSSLFLPEQQKKPNLPENKRKPSVQIKKNDYNLTLDDQPLLKINQKKQEPFKSPPFLPKQSSLRLDSPKQNNRRDDRSSKQKNNSYQTNQNEKKLWQPEKSYMVQQSKNNYGNSLKIESQEKTSSHSELQKQMEFMKRNYQKHIDTLQKNLQEQIKSNKDSRDRLMKEVNTMIESERKRMTKIHDEEIDRLKKMNQWEKKKMEENYKVEIDSLKSQLERAQVMNQSSQPQGGYSSIEIDKKQIRYLEEKLRSQRRSLEEREKILERRQLTIEENQRQFTKKKRHQQERLRDQEKRIFHAEAQSKKNLMYQRKALEEEKQAMAAQLASLQLTNFKKAEMSQNIISQLQMQKRQLEREKRQIREIQNQMMKDYKQKQEELRHQKQELSRLESELIHKLRIVEAKAQKDNIKNLDTTNHGKTKVNKTVNYKQNTWMQGNEEKGGRPMSSQKVNQHKKIQETQNRFWHITQNLKESLKSSHKGGGFDIDNYMMSMAKFTRTRDQVY